MAIGLGRMFGFEFQENFNFPYKANSIKDFWHRWHISLSTFFKDYVYIPLGGNRVKKSKIYFNLIFVFFVTGFWHGASWSFVVWGLFHGFFMITERLGFEKILQKSWKPLANLYTLLVVMFAWVLFKAETLTYAMNYWNALINFKTSPDQIAVFMGYINVEFIIVTSITLLGAFGFLNFLNTFFLNSVKRAGVFASVLTYAYHSSSILIYLAITGLCTMYLMAGTYNPFIYYKF